MLAAQPMAKIYAASFDGEVRDFIAIFHRWIQNERTEELLIDVHDYSHVHEGPGIILVAHECIYAMDLGEGRLGLSYKRRRGAVEPADGGLASAVARAAHGCRLLESDAPGLRFSTAEVLVGFDDALNAPGEAATFEAMKHDLEALAGRIFASEGRVADASEPRGPFRARLSGQAQSLETIAAALAG